MLNSLLYDPHLPEVGRALLKRLESKEITMEEFEKECAYWMLSMVNDFKYKELPEIPSDLEEFYDHRLKDPSYKLSSEFWELPHVKLYLIEARRIKADNSSNFYWLKWMRQRIPKEDTVALGKIKGVLKTYEMAKRDYESSARVLPAVPKTSYRAAPPPVQYKDE